MAGAGRCLYDASVDARAGGVAIPILWGTDTVHGHSNIVGVTLFPHNVGLGAMHDPALMKRITQAAAIEIRATGMEWTFAPTVTVPQDGRWGRAFEGYSQDPKLLSSYVGQFIKGLHGKPGSSNILAGPYVPANTKHFLVHNAFFHSLADNAPSIAGTKHPIRGQQDGQLPRHGKWHGLCCIPAQRQRKAPGMRFPLRQQGYDHNVREVNLGDIRPMSIY